MLPDDANEHASKSIIERRISENSFYTTLRVCILQSSVIEITTSIILGSKPLSTKHNWAKIEHKNQTYIVNRKKWKTQITT